MRNHLLNLALSFVLIFPLAVTVSAQEKTAETPQLNQGKYPDVDDAILLFKRGNAAGALSLLRTAKQKHPEISPPEVMLARLYFAANQPEQGQATIQSAIVMHTADPEPWNLLAELEFKSRNWAAAELLFDKARQANRKIQNKNQRLINQRVAAYNGLARTYEVRGVWDQAEKILSEWNSLDSDNVGILKRLANAQLNLGKVSEATLALQKIKSLDAKQLPAEVSLALHYQKRGEVEQAKASMDNALKKDRQSFNTQVAVARWAITAGEFKTARQCAAVATTLERESLIPKLINASIDLYEGNAPSAEKQFRDIYREKPGDFETIVGLAMSLLKQDDAAKKTQGLEHAKVLANSNKDPRTSRGRQALSLLAWGLYRTGNLDQADQLMQGVVTSGELSPEIAFYAATIFAEKDRKDLARQLVEKALASPISFVHETEARKLQGALK